MNISKTGMHSQQRALSLIANNIANMNTQGFKAKNVNFQSLLSNDITEDSRLSTNDITISAGARSQQGGMNVQNGAIFAGAGGFDLSLKEDGFFGIQNSAGDFYLTRDGSFTVDHLGQLVNSNGDFLVVNGEAPFVVENPAEFSIKADGTITGLVNGEMTNLGSIPVYLPNNIQNLRAEGNNYYSVPAGELAITANAANIQVGYLEMSNVDIAKEITNMIVAQRAYSLNVKVAQTTDEIKTMTNHFS